MHFLETIRGFLSPVFSRIPLSGKKRTRDEDEAADMPRPETKKAQPSNAHLTELATLPASQPEVPVVANETDAAIGVTEFVAAGSSGSGTAPAFGMRAIVQESWPLDKPRLEPHRRSALLQVQGPGAQPSPFAPVQPASMLDRATHLGASSQAGLQQPVLPPRAQPLGLTRPQVGASGPHAAPAVPGPRPAPAPLPPGLASTPGGSSTPALTPGLGRGWVGPADTPGGPQPQRLAFDTPSTATQRLNSLTLASPGPGPSSAAAGGVAGAARIARTPTGSAAAPLYTPGLRPLPAGSAFEAAAAAAAGPAGPGARRQQQQQRQQPPLPPPSEWRRSPGPAGLGPRPPLPIGGRSPAPSTAAGAAAVAAPQPYATTHQALALMTAAQAMQQVVSLMAAQGGFAGLASGEHARQLALMAGTPLPQVPFARTLAAVGAELAAPGGDLALGGAVARYLEQRRQQQQQQQRVAAAAGPNVAAAPTAVVREDGGYIGEDDDEPAAASRAEVDSLTARLRQAARRSSALVHGPGGDGGAAAAAAAERVRLSRAVESGGAEALQMIGLKLDAHAQVVSRLRQSAAADTQRKVAHIKAVDEARRREQQQQRLDAAAAAAQQQAAAAAGGGAAPARVARVAAPPPRKRVPAARPPPPAADDDVLDLISSSEEEEEEEVEEVNLTRPVTTAEMDTWRLVMDKEADPKQTLLAYAPNPATDIKLTRDKLRCLAAATWLNDEVINLYMLLLQERDTRLRQLGGGGGGGAANGAAGGGGGGGVYPRCHFFNSFFYNKLFQDENKYNYANVRRWTMPARLRNGMQATPDQSVLLLDRVLLPVHQGIHWCCAEVDIAARAVRYYDSLKGEDRQCVQHLLQWVADESQDKLKSRWDTSKWTVEFPKNIPTQRNGCDCGVFALMFADRRGAGLAHWDFDQPHMELLRRRVLQRLMRMRVDLY